MLFVSMSGPRREVVPRLCVSGATLWVQGKWGLKMASWGWGVLGALVSSEAAMSRGGNTELGGGALVSLTSHTWLEPVPSWRACCNAREGEGVALWLSRTLKPIPILLESIKGILARGTP